MRTVGALLIHAGVVLRYLIRLPRLEHPAWVLALLMVNGALLLIEAWLARRRPLPAAQASPIGAVLRPLYLLFQCGIVLGLLLNRPVMDFSALLFVPISMSAVLFYGRRRGFLWIAAFTLLMAGALMASQRGWVFGAVMALSYGGLCYLFGGYAHQVRQADAAREEAQRMVGELQTAHGQLQAYAGQREELAAEHERNRLARELHDSVTQTVFSMNLTVQTARLLLDRDRRRTAGQLQRLEELAASAMREIQALVSHLRPTASEEGLTVALCRLVAERRTRDGLDVSLEVSGDRVLPEPAATGLFLIAQEALANVAKHAGVKEATVRLRLIEGAALLEVEDHGGGFAPQAAANQQGHLGLAGMAERARDLGWRLSIESEPGRGTRIRVAEIRSGDAE